MERVIVAVQRIGETRTCDLELPAEIPVSDLTCLIAEALHWDESSSTVNYSVKVFPQGKKLTNQETLLSANVRTGSTLEFFSATDDYTPKNKNENPDSDKVVTTGYVWGGPVVGVISVLEDFRPSALPDDPTQDAPIPPTESTPKNGYTWKKLS